jgi:hypothetical protein
MKTTVKVLAWLALTGIFWVSCSQDKSQSLDDILSDAKQQEKVFSAIAADHEMSKNMMAKMMESDHTMGMMVDQLVNSAAEDSLLANKLSDMITNYPALMLLTMHHFMPVIDADSTMCEGFCDHAMEHSNIAEGMCHSMKEHEGMTCCQ